VEGIPLRRALAAILAPAIGFATGGAIAGASGDLLFFGIVAWGLVGAVATAWFWNEKPSRSAIAGVAAFLLGAVAPLVLFGSSPRGLPPPLSLRPLALIGAFAGLLLGFGLGWAWKRPGAAALLGLWGAGGFAIGFAIVPPDWAANPDPVAAAAWGALWLAIAGLVGGGFLGLGSYFARSPQPQHNANLHERDPSSAE
jgi:hypothetical protein